MHREDRQMPYRWGDSGCHPLSTDFRSACAHLLASGSLSLSDLLAFFSSSAGTFGGRLAVTPSLLFLIHYKRIGRKGNINFPFLREKREEGASARQVSFSIPDSATIQTGISSMAISKSYQLESSAPIELKMMSLRMSRWSIWQLLGYLLILPLVYDRLWQHQEAILFSVALEDKKEAKEEKRKYQMRSRRPDV